MSLFSVPYCYSFVSVYRYRGQNDMFLLRRFIGRLGVRQPTFLRARGMVPYCVFVNYIMSPEYVRTCLHMRSLRERQLDYQYPCSVIYSTQSDTDDHLPIKFLLWWFGNSCWALPKKNSRPTPRRKNQSSGPNLFVTATVRNKTYTYYIPFCFFPLTLFRFLVTQ
jgi:hypothetical protein